MAPDIFTIPSDHIRIVPPDVSASKDTLLAHLVQTLAAAYRWPDAPARLDRVLRREALGTSGIGGHLAVLSPGVRRDEDVATAHPVGDLWFFLIPAGIDLEAIDAEPVHVVACPVFRHPWRRNGCYPEMSTFMSCWATVSREQTAALSRMTAETAAGWLTEMFANPVELER